MLTLLPSLWVLLSSSFVEKLTLPSAEAVAFKEWILDLKYATKK
jgi:hypothetical protein